MCRAPTPDPATEARRCIVCGARDWRPAGRTTDPSERYRCSHCGLLVALDAYDAAALAASLEALLRPGSVALPRSGWGIDDPAWMDAYTLRIAASGRSLAFEPGDGSQAAALAHPHSRHPARGWLRALAPAPARVALGMIVRASEVDDALGFVRKLLPRFAEAVIVADGPVADDALRPGDAIRVLSHPLDGDFGAQRTRVQRACRSPWVLQLDADETPSDSLLDAMDALTAQADRQGLVSIGLPRRNLVDGEWSDLYPDIQYRLNRREVVYSGRVHERPDLKGAWRRSMIAPAATLDHALARERVERRSREYEALATGGGRPGDEAALLRPYRP